MGLKMGFIETTPRWKYSMLAMDKGVVFAVKSMDKTRLTITRIGTLLSLGIILEIASLVALTDALPTSMDLSDNTYEAVKRAGFVGMRGKKAYGFDNQGDLLQYLSMLYQQQPVSRNLQSTHLKRAGFVGMRGKKSTIGDESVLQKRAAFVGMRGRRGLSELGYDGMALPYSIQDMEEEMSPKERRAGFVGMRG